MVSPCPFQVEVPAPIRLQPLSEVSIVPPAATPEEAFDLIAAAAAPLSDTPEAAFDLIAAAAAPPPADTPEEAFDLIAAAAAAAPPPANTPEATFDMIAAENLQPAATVELDSDLDPETEEPAAAGDAGDAPPGEPEENVDGVLPEEEEIDLQREDGLFLYRYSKSW